MLIDDAGADGHRRFIYSLSMILTFPAAISFLADLCIHVLALIPHIGRD
jgi:hypothetical protein